MGEKGSNRKSILMMVASMLIFGTIGIFRRSIPVSSAFLAFSRGMLGSLFLVIFLCVRKRKGAGKIPRKTAVWLVLSGAAIGFNWILLFEAYNYTTVAVATLCYYMQPTIVVLLSPLVFRERLTVKKTACAAVAIVGMVLVSGVTDAGGWQPGSLRGVLSGLGAAVLYSAVVIMNKRIAGVDIWRKTTIQLFTAGAVMIPYLLATGEFDPGPLSAKTVALLLTVGIIHTGIAYVLYFGSLEGLKAQSAAILSYIDPVAALLFSALWLKEQLSAAGIIGAVMIIGSAIVSEIRGRGNKGDPPATYDSPDI